MSSQIQLIIAPPYQGDISCVRIDNVSMAILGVKEGEKVLVTTMPFFGITSGRQTVAKVARTKVADEGKGLIRISPDIQSFSFGEKVLVIKQF
jgi:hypothetical protein